MQRCLVGRGLCTGLVLEAADAKELNQTLDFLLNGKILVEAP